MPVGFVPHFNLVFVEVFTRVPAGPADGGDRPDEQGPVGVEDLVEVDAAAERRHLVDVTAAVPQSQLVVLGSHGHLGGSRGHVR
jgi:hypothetical protein